MVGGYGLTLSQPQAVGTDPTPVAAQVVSGIGFLGASAIVQSGASIRGLTTAATLWISGALGVAAGAGVYLLLGACLATVQRPHRRIGRRGTLPIRRACATSGWACEYVAAPRSTSWRPPSASGRESAACRSGDLITAGSKSCTRSAGLPERTEFLLFPPLSGHARGLP